MDDASAQEVSALSAEAPERRRLHPALGLAVKGTISILLLAWLLARTDYSRLMTEIGQMSLIWLIVALSLYLVMIVVSAWRWALLLVAQQAPVRTTHLINSYLVATFFNNFMPSNVGGDVVRVLDTVGAVGSRTRAAMIVLIDRGIGLLGLLLVAAAAASLVDAAAMPVPPLALWLAFASAFAGLTLIVMVPRALAVLDLLRAARSAWVDERLLRIADGLRRFRDTPGALLFALAGAVVVQLVLVGFYSAIASGLHIHIPTAHLAVLVPVSFLVQMLPISINGFGVREATFGYYFTLLNLPLEQAVLLSLTSAGATILFSVSGLVVYSLRGARGSRAARPA
jgi:uncharacterized protein (TIRG00374 family)